MTNEMCPQCGHKGLSVDNATIKSLISVTLHRVADVYHRFCPQADCSVVYYAEDNSEIFYTHELRERVYQKEPASDDVFVCYCFLHTVGDVRNSVNDNGKNPIIEDIRMGIQQGRCACDWRNPEGQCCLGNVVRIVKKYAPK